jgi:hypothetical protein
MVFGTIQDFGAFCLVQSYNATEIRMFLDIEYILQTFIDLQ